jgi:hypothetical protein
VFSHGCLAECAAVFLEMARFLQRFLPIRGASRVVGTGSRGGRWNDVMNKASNGTFGIIIGGVVAVIAVIFILTGGELGGKKTVQGDQDLPPVATSGD